jgi:hypothetical protein
MWAVASLKKKKMRIHILINELVNHQENFKINSEICSVNIRNRNHLYNLSTLYVRETFIVFWNMYM